MNRALFSILSLATFLANSSRSDDGLPVAARIITMGWPEPLSNEECWKLLPTPLDGAGQPLPTWARMLALEMPKTTAAFLELDRAHRDSGPVEPTLRAALRWVTANANHCEYAKQTASFDARRAGISKSKWSGLESNNLSEWSPSEKAALEFAMAMALDSDGYSDKAFANLVQLFSERQVASMVLHMAYANFQDRWLMCLGAPLEAEGPKGPVTTKFDPQSLIGTSVAPSVSQPVPVPLAAQIAGKNVVEHQVPNTWLSYPLLQKRLDDQRHRQTRLRIPQWKEFADKLPAALRESSVDIVWYQIAYGYADELAVPFEIYLRTAGSEISKNWDRVFGNSLFWIVTDATKCPYCMGHCEMNWEVAGLSLIDIARRSEVLAGNDWSSFSPAQQQALAFARTLTKTPWAITRTDMDKLREGFGNQRAFFIALNTSRYNYMTRISNGFQLTLESTNVFWDYYRMKPPAAANSTEAPK